MDCIEVVELIERLPIRTIVRDRSNPLEDLTSSEFKERFRLRKDSTVSLLRLIENDLTCDTERNNYIPPILQLLTALRFYATGNLQRIDGDLTGIARSTTCKIVHRVTRSIASRRGRFVKFPTGSTDEIRVKLAFRSFAGFPGVLGAIDCTHIPIINPGGNESEIYRCRKGYFSINVQAVCDPDQLITNIVARWHGSAHDSIIFRSSALCNSFERGRHNGLLIGDAGYSCTSYLMTPLRNPITRKERRYNVAHRRTRNVVERTFGVLKQRFRCLLIPLRTDLTNTLPIVVACACLHNYAIRLGDFYAGSEDGILQTETNNDVSNTHLLPIPPNTPTGEAVRQQLIENNF